MRSISGRSEDRHTASMQRRTHCNVLAERNKQRFHTERPDYTGFKSLDLLAVRQQNIRATLGPVGVKFVTYTMQKNARAAVCAISDFCSILIGIVKVIFKGVDLASCSSSVCSQWVVGENGVLKPKRVNPNVYQPPSLKGRCGRHNSRWRSCVGTYPCVRAQFFVCRASPQSTASITFLFFSFFDRGKTNTCMWQMGRRALKKTPKNKPSFFSVCMRMCDMHRARCCAFLLWALRRLPVFVCGGEKGGD